MRYKEDWEMAKKRHAALWEREIIDRCCIGVTARRKNAKLWEKERIPTSDEERTAFWTDPEWQIERGRREMENTYFGGEAFPVMAAYLGAGGHAGFYKGAKHYFANDTVWFFPSLTDPDSLEFDENSFLYQKTLELSRAFAQDSNGDYIVAMPDATGNADALSHLMGPESLLTAMLDEPEAVKRALGKIQLAYEKVMKNVYDIVRDVNGGGSSVAWLHTWAPGFHSQMQCDMSVMISNPMFREFIRPELEKQSAFLEYPLYHFDGCEQIRHLDDLLAIPRLRLIQWTQVAGQRPCTDFFPELKRIQEAGKCLFLSVSPDQIRPVMENLSSKGLYLFTRVDTQEAADAIIKEVARLTHE